MTFRKDALAIFILTYAFTEVASWTIDLPEVRKFLFEKNEHSKQYEKHNNDDYLYKDQKFYSNIEGNSKHHEEDHRHGHYDNGYVEEYDQQSYMEKKVYHIIRDGSTYLEGLQKSLEDYSLHLKGCEENKNSSWESTNNSTASNPSTFDSSSNFSSSNSSNETLPMLNFNNYENSTVPLRPKYPPETRSYMRGSRRKMSCDEATDVSENIRRYAALAMQATRRLQDLVYAKKYEKTDEQEENELILKLAWFLDRLAYLSGYEPEYKHYEPSITRAPSTESPTAPTLVPSSDELNKEFRDCLKRHSSVPATVRCRYPLQIPDLMQQMMNSSDTTPSPSSQSSVNTMSPSSSASDSIAEQSSEILITSANTSPSDTSPQKSEITKRSTDYTYYFPTKPLHEVTYPVPVLKLIKHRLSNIKSVVKSIVEKRLQHLAEKKEEKHHYEKHFEKRSINDNNSQLSNYIPISNNDKSVGKSIEKRPFESESILIHYPISDVSVINTKSFKKRSIDDSRTTANHINKLSNSKSFIKSAKKPPIIRKKFENLRLFTKIAKRGYKNTDPKIRSIKKRYTEDPLSKLANYYIKYKVWDNSNPIKKSFNKKPTVFEVKNQLNEPKSIQKRSLFNKKVIHMHIPKPIQVVRTYINGHRPHGHEKSKILSHLHKLHEIKYKNAEKLHKIIKRSVHYQRMFLPRVPIDPQGDISYYIKNKEGTNINPDQLQAAQVRFGLEQVFQTGNIEVVRRFGANYNPLNPNPFYSGVLASFADS